MKKSFVLLSAAAALVMAACTPEILPEETVVPEEKIGLLSGPASFTASFEADPATRAVLGLNGDGKPQTFWENGDAISVYSSNDTDLSSAAGHKFTTTLSVNSLEATFEWDNEGSIPSGNYLATYPNRTAGRGVNFSVSPYRVAAVDVPKSQTLVAGTVDRKACPMVAHASEGSNNLEFKNAAALLKFRVSESNIVAGRIAVDAADAISGRFRADVDVTTFIPTLVTYTGQTYYNYIDFSLNDNTALASGTDYYVAIRPTELTSDLKVYLNGNLVKVINKSQFSEIKRNKIYNLGTLTTPATPLEKVLFFDFTVDQSSVDPNSSWPTAKGTAATNQTGGLLRPYNLYGVQYQFTLADCSGASGQQIFWSHTNTYGHRIVFNAAERYFGTPAIEGYKLVNITATSSRLDNTTASETLEPKIGIVSNIVASKETPTYVSGGDLQTWAAGNNHEAYNYALSGTEGNTVYYLYAKVKGAVQTLTLTYVPI